MLKIKNLSNKHLNGFHALRGVDLQVSAGRFGLLGPNGAGKFSLMCTASLTCHAKANFAHAIVEHRIDRRIVPSSQCKQPRQSR